MNRHLLTPFRYDVWDDLTCVGRRGDAICVWQAKDAA